MVWLWPHAVRAVRGVRMRRSSVRSVFCRVVWLGAVRVLVGVPDLLVHGCALAVVMISVVEPVWPYAVWPLFGLVSCLAVSAPPT
jgi:hypothetical protein